MKQPLISVVVCTFNRSAILQGCLESLIQQKVERSLYEVIIIDNNSTDETGKIARSYCEKYDFILFTEFSQGLSHARNRGFQEAQGQYIAYIDDDARAYADWISEMINFITRWPDVAVFGGPYDAFTLVDKPDWFPPEYGILNHGDKEHSLIFGQEWLTGSNMVIRKEVLAACGGFHVELGMSSGKVAYGEETRLFVDLYQQGYELVYVPGMKVQHLIAEYKMNLHWLLHASYVAGRCSELSYNKQTSLPAHFFHLFKGIIKMLLELVSFRNIPWKRRVFYAFDSLFYKVGAFVKYLEK